VAGKAKHESLWLAYASVALVLPIAEEIIFRSYLFDALRSRFSGKTVVIVTAFAFSLVHLQWVYLVPLFGFGLVLGWVRLKTNSLRLPILLHVINNGLFLALAT
jgi:membrane protease YdiL (CAAX protease family)